MAAAGNAGPVGSIVGAPSTAEDAISVAASIDGMEKNWTFPAVKFSTVNNPMILTEAVEGAITQSTLQSGNVTGNLVAIGLAAKDLTPEQMTAVKGNIALIDRGEVPFG